MAFYQYYATCPVCGCSFKRYDIRKRYCTNACRQKAYRQRKAERQFQALRSAAARRNA